MNRLVTRLSVLLLLLPLLAACSGVQVLNAITPDSGYALAEDVIYDAATGQRLDVYQPAGVQDAPVVVFFYGGRWTSGLKKEYRFVGQALAARGFVTIIPDLRQYPLVRFPDFVNDAARAVRWAHDNAARYGGSPNRLVVMGHSSGAHIASMLALNEEYLKGVGGSRQWLRGMIGLAGPYDFLPLTDPDLRDIFGPPEQFELSQPIFFVDGHSPPLLLMHGEDDEMVEARNSHKLAEAVVRAGGTVETVFYPKLSHERMVATIGLRLQGLSDVIDHVTNFIRNRTQ